MMPREKYPTGDSDVPADSRLARASELPAPVSTSSPTNIAAPKRNEQFAGSLLGSKYRLVKQLGSGGMGSVWLATNESLGSDVAIKFIRNDLDNPILTQRLLTEARAIARLEHPNIVRAYDVGQTEAGQPFVVMELLRGPSLGAKIRREGRLSPTVAVQTLLPIAHALTVTHGAGIVHRDLKPDNIILEMREDLGIRPVLLDYSIAKDHQTGTAKLTQDGSTLGSPEYMSPEQARGDEVDERADIWAFCVVLYEALLGHAPFTDTNYHRLLRRIIDEPLPSFSRSGVKDDELWTILERGLRKQPSERFESMRSLGVALARWLLDMGVTEDTSHGAVRATWLHLPAVHPRKDRERYAESVGTLASIPSAPPATTLPGPPSKQRHLSRRFTWFAAIFIGSMLLTTLARSWLHKSTNPGGVPSTSTAKATPVTAAQVPGGTAEVAPDSSVAANAASASVHEVRVTAALGGSNAAPLSIGIDRLGTPGAMKASSPRLQSSPRPGHGAKPAGPTTSAKLDIKTDF